MDIFKKIMLSWLIVGLVFWTFYILVIEMIYPILYFHLILICVGIPIWKYNDKIKEKLQNFKLNNFAKFMILGYFTVMFEETFAAFFNHLTEGFNLLIYFQRIGQFYLLNFFVFTGFYLAWYYLLKKYKFTYTFIFFTAGTWGLFSERIIFQLIINPVSVVFTAPLVIFVYGLMITLPMLSINLKGEKELNPITKYMTSMLSIFLFSVIPILILGLLRTKYPYLFPPVSLIPL